MKKGMCRCQHCLEEMPWMDLLKHEDRCPDNLENVDEGSAEECGDLYGSTE